MKINAFAAAVTLLTSATALSAETETHQWHLRIDNYARLCSFSDNIPVELVADPTSGRFELAGAGNLTILAQGMEEISYITNGAIIDTKTGRSIGKGQDWDFSQTTLAGNRGNMFSVPSCSDNSCFGVDFKLPNYIASDTYTLTVEGLSLIHI